MAFNNFYISGGSDLNAGSTSADAGGSNTPSLTYAAGTFVRSTGVFTVASGNPLSDGVLVNDWVSIYTTAGAVAATFVGKCTARDATTITVSTTTILGLASSVSESAGATTAKVGGAWASEIVLAATGLGTFTTSISLKIHIKQATYTFAASRTISMSGAQTAPIWFSGYNTTPGDLDADTTNTLSKPVFSLSTNGLVSSGEFQTWSSISVTGARTGYQWTTTQNTFRMIRCRVEATSSNVNAHAMDVIGGFFAYSYFKAPTTATGIGVVDISQVTHFTGCVFEGGGQAGVSLSTQSCRFYQCVFLNNTGQGILATTAGISVTSCTFYNPTADGIRWSSTPIDSALATVNGCLFSGCGGYGINSNVGTNVDSVYRACNDFYNCTSGNENGFGDSPAFFGQTDSSQVVRSASDLTPVQGSHARRNGFPGTFENEAFSSYPEAGAVQHADRDRATVRIGL